MNKIWNTIHSQNKLLQFSTRSTANIQQNIYRFNRPTTHQFSIWKSSNNFYRQNTLQKPWSLHTISTNAPSIPLSGSLLCSAQLNTTQIRQKVSTVYQKKMKQFKPPKKLKTKSAAKKRFYLSNTGTLKRRSSSKQHHAWAKNRNKINQLGKWKTIEGKMKKNMLQLLGSCKK